MTQYQFGHEWQQERDRLASLEQFEDPGTIRHLQRIGIGSGWRCLEVGAGGGSIAAWLCEQVGSTGHVVTTDLETKFVAALHHPNLEVRRQDIASDELPEEAFDLIHERAVLLHIPTRHEVLARLVNALKPGGWLLCEDTDFSTFGSPFAAVRRVAAAMIQFLESQGADPNYGRRLFGDLRAMGLLDVGAEGRVYMMRGGHPSSVLPRLTFERIRDPIVASGAASKTEFDEALALLNDPEMAVMSPVMMAAWGRRANGQPE